MRGSETLGEKHQRHRGRAIKEAVSHLAMVLSPDRLVDCHHRAGSGRERPRHNRDTPAGLSCAMRRVRSQAVRSRITRK